MLQAVHEGLQGVQRLHLRRHIVTSRTAATSGLCYSYSSSSRAVTVVKLKPSGNTYLPLLLGVQVGLKDPGQEGELVLVQAHHRVQAVETSLGLMVLTNNSPPTRSFSPTLLETVGEANKFVIQSNITLISTLITVDTKFLMKTVSVVSVKFSVMWSKTVLRPGPVVPAARSARREERASMEGGTRELPTLATRQPSECSLQNWQGGKADFS